MNPISIKPYLLNYSKHHKPTAYSYTAKEALLKMGVGISI
jgi:hypothetical protein